MKEIVDYGIGIASLFVLYGTFNIWRAILKTNNKRNSEEYLYIKTIIEEQMTLIRETTKLVQEIRILVERENVMLNEVLERLRQWQ